MPNDDLEIINVNSSNQKATKNELETNQQINDFVRNSNPKKCHKQVPISFQNQPTYCHLQLRVHPAAPMVLQGCPRGAKMASQGAPQVPKWPPKFLPSC